MRRVRAHCIEYLISDNHIVFNVINFEFFSVPKMLKNLSVFVCYCNSHNFIFLSDFYLIKSLRCNHVSDTKLLSLLSLLSLLLL